MSQKDAKNGGIGIWDIICFSKDMDEKNN